MIKSPDREQLLATALAGIEKQFGKGSVMIMGDKVSMEVETISTGCLALDIALGVGGLPRGRITEIYGPESCIRGDAHIKYKCYNRFGRMINGKGGTLERLYEKFHRKNIRRTDKKVKYFTVPSMNDKGRIVHSRVTNVVDMGVKPVYEIVVSTGEKVHATSDHQFFTPDGYQELQNLSVGSTVMIDNFYYMESNFKSQVQESVVISINQVGDYQVYDISVEDPYRNFVASGFVVHNCGKTTLAMHVVAEAQKLGGTCGYIDTEHAVDPAYSSNIGVDIDKLLISQPDTGEEALEIADALIKTGALDVLVIDSVAALVPRAEIEGEMGSAHIGLQARLMSQAMRKIVGNLSKAGTVVIFINQLREKVGVMWGSPEVTSGGRALKYYASVRIDIRRVESIKDGAEVSGNRTRAKIVKNKVARPFTQAEFDIVFGEGISTVGSLVDVAVDVGVITKSGSWFAYDGEQIGHGKENAKKYLLNDPAMMNEIDTKVRLQVGLPVGAV